MEQLSCKHMEYADWVKKFRPIQVMDPSEGPYDGCVIDHNSYCVRALVRAMATHLGLSEKFDAMQSEGRLVSTSDVVQPEALRELFGDEHIIRDHVWTVVESDGIWGITSGWAHVNREGYILTKEPHDKTSYEVFDLSDWDSARFDSWTAPLLTNSDAGTNEDDDETVSFMEAVGVSINLIESTLFETEFFDRAFVHKTAGGYALDLALAPQRDIFLSWSDGEGKECRSVLNIHSECRIEFRPGQDFDREKQPLVANLAASILDSVIPCEGQRYKPFDPDKFEFRKREHQGRPFYEIGYDGQALKSVPADVSRDVALRIAHRIYYVGMSSVLGVRLVEPLCLNYPKSTTVEPRP